MNPKQFPSLRRRFAIVLILLAAAFTAGVSYILYLNFKAELRSDLRHRLENITKLASLQQDGDLLLKVRAQGDEAFNIIQERNANIKRTEPELIFVYTLRKDEQGNIYFVVDARISPDEPDISNFGDRYEQPSDTLSSNFDTMSQPIIEPEIYTDEFGSFLSGYAPIFTSDGDRAGVLGVDISAETIHAQEQRFLIRLSIILVPSLILIVLGGLVFANYLAKPIINLRDMANRISQGELNTHISNIPKTRELAELAINLNNMTTNLSELINDLEQRVAERTSGLTKKTDQLRTASFIARQTADVQQLSSILEIVVDLVTNQFGYYHAGIYLMNETGNEAVLQAASSEGGKRMVERGEAVDISTPGIISYVASQKRARVAVDIGTDAVYFNNPDLPLTRSEVALPLIIRDKVLGVLDIQSDQPQAFRAEDIDVFQTLADQVAVAIDNARLLGESQAALLQLEAVSSHRTRDAWNQKLFGQGLAFTFTPLGIRLETHAPAAGEKDVQTPITLRGQTIGSISLGRKDHLSWNKFDEDLIQEVAYQVGLAVDNLRLLEDAQQHARQEQTIGELATRFSQALDIDSLLQTAARELGQMPDVSEVSVYIGQLPEPTPQKRRPKRGTG
jgi:GAF domain-containing protein/HAMP domain-containing protein